MQEKSKNIDMVFLQYNVRIILSVLLKEDCPMSKTTLFDSRIKKYAYRETSQIYQDIGVSPDGLYYFVGNGRFSRLQFRQKYHYCHHYLFHDPN